MDNINREMQNNIEINNNILRMGMEPERNEHKNIKREKTENDLVIGGLAQLDL